MKSVVILDDKNYDKWLLKQRDTVTPVWAQAMLDLRGGNHVAMPPCDPPRLSDRNLQRDSSIAKSLETVGGTVSRKEKFGFTCESCLWVPAKGGIADWVPGMFGSYHGLHFPERCKRCKARIKRYTCAERNYDRLELLRI